MAKRGNKQKLIVATDKLLQNNSLFAINTKDITKAAGVSVGVFYNYFKSKEDVFKEVIKHFFQYSLETLEQLKKDMTGRNVRSEVKFKEFLLDGIDKNWENHFLNGDIMMLSRSDEQFKAMMDSYSEQTIELVTDIIMTIWPKMQTRPTVTAMIVMNLIQSSQPTFVQFNSAQQKEEYIDKLVMIVYNLCFTQDQP